MRKCILSFSIILCIGILLCGCGSGDSNKGKLKLEDYMKRNIERTLKTDPRVFEYDVKQRVYEKDLDILIWGTEVTKYKQIDDYNYKVWVVYDATDAYNETVEIKSTVKAYCVADDKMTDGYRIMWDVSAFDSDVRKLK